MDDEQIKEASWAVQSVVGASAYLHGIDYNLERFRRELNRTVEYIKNTAEVTEYA